MPTIEDIHTALKNKSLPEKIPLLMKYFKAIPGGYGEGDTFLGVTVPEQRAIAKQFWKQATLDDINQLLTSGIHEHRLTALFLLIHQYEAVKKDKILSAEEKLQQQKVYIDFYLAHLSRVNNRDLVDASAPGLLGDRIVQRDELTCLEQLSTSQNLWQERVSVLATFPLIGKGEYIPSLRLAEYFLKHPHDLMHKAVGWMLREIGKKEKAVLLTFLSEHCYEMPGVMLSYAMEHLTAEERAFFRSVRASQKLLTKK